MLAMCRALGSRLLLVLVHLLACNGRFQFSREGPAKARDARSALWHPHRLRSALLGRHVNEYPQAWQIVADADRANLGLALDSFHMLATHTSREALEEIDPAKILRAARRLHVARDPLA